MSSLLDVPVSYFFDEMPSNALSGQPMSGRGRKGCGEVGTPFEREKDPLIKRETLELVRAYYKIREARVRKRIFSRPGSIWAPLMRTLLALPQSTFSSGTFTPFSSYRIPRLFAPILGIIASSRVCALRRSSTVRKPAFAKARPAPRVSPFRCQDLDASQYSSNDDGLCLMMSVTPIP
jgi:hypothetical protein